MNTETILTKALSVHLDCNESDLVQRDYDHYGLTVFEFGDREYAIGTDEEAQTAAETAIADSAWAFNAEFILGQCNLPLELAPAMKAWQEKECEGCNEAIVDMIETHCPGGMTGSHSFSEDAILADGRGRLLPSYDSAENEVEYDDGDGKVTFYVYRLN